MSEAIEERGIPPLRGGGGMNGKLRVMVLAFVVLFFLVVVGLVVYSKWKRDRAAAEEAAPTQPQLTSENRDTDVKEPPGFVKAALENRRAADAAAGPGGTPAAPPTLQDGADLPPPPAVDGAGASSPGHQPTKAELEEADKQERRQRAPVLAWSRTNPSLGGTAQKGPAAGSEDAEPAAQDPYQAAMMAAINASHGNGESSTPTRSPLDQALQSDAVPVAVASRAANASFTVPQGTMGRCVMRTAFNSQLAGFSSCTLSQPIYSADGRFVMAEPGSEITGTYQTGQVKPGVSRAFVLWTRLRTPAGVVISLDSPATDGLGRTGITGRVNNHFWQRFGSGLLLSMVDDAVAMARNGSAEDYRSTSQSMNDAAAIAVQNSVNIPPTITTKAGAVVNIFVARDLDFSSVYTARLADGAGAK